MKLIAVVVSLIRYLFKLNQTRRLESWLTILCFMPLTCDLGSDRNF